MIAVIVGGGYDKDTAVGGGGGGAGNMRDWGELGNCLEPNDPTSANCTLI